MKTEFSIIFGEVLREFRLSKKLTQYELAELSDLDYNYISMLETAIRAPSLLTVFKIAKGLGITPALLVEKVDKRMKG